MLTLPASTAVITGDGHDPLNDDVLATGLTPLDLAHRPGPDGCQPACGNAARVYRHGAYRVRNACVSWCSAEQCYPEGWERSHG